MDKRLRPLLTFFFFLLLIACKQLPNELRYAEQLMENRPDSALHILQKINPVSCKSPSDRALYGLLYFDALDKLDKPLGPDSLIDFSIKHYLAGNENLNLAKSYFYKARMLKKRQRFDAATEFYLKSLDLLNSTDRYILLGNIYSDLADICIIQKDHNESLKKVLKAIDYFNKVGNKVESAYRVVTIGKIYRFREDFKTSDRYYKQALTITLDSIIQGFAFQEIGINYYLAKQNDSAQYYLRKSLQFPYRGTNYAVRCFYLADLLYNITQYDSAFSYAKLALKYPSTFFNQRECYRILSNTEYHRGDFDKMGIYLSKYQSCADSVRKIEIQSKATMLESLYNNDQQKAETKRSMIWVTSVFILVLLFSGGVVYLLFQRNKLKKEQLGAYKQELNQKQEFVTQNIFQKIAEMRDSQAEIRRNASPEEWVLLDKELMKNAFI